MFERCEDLEREGGSYVGTGEPPRLDWSELSPPPNPNCIQTIQKPQSKNQENIKSKYQNY